MQAPDEPRGDACRLAMNLIADALPDLAARIAAVEARVGDLAAAAPPDAEARIALQDLDLIRQTVADLARLAGAAMSGGDMRPDALSQVLLLAALRNRVTGGPAEPRPPVAADRGAVDLFLPPGAGGG